MFTARETLKENLLGCFKSSKNVRIIIVCFEVFAQSSGDFSEQRNMYMNKNHTTFKCLVESAPTVGVSLLSDTFDGSISDKSICKQSGLYNLLKPGDLVIANLGFLIRAELEAKK